jgi:predicted dehydrogenase
MLAQETLDAVFIVTGYNPLGRPLYPAIAMDCLAAGCHVWMEKPPAASCAEIKRLQQAAAWADRQVMVGFKKMFFPLRLKFKDKAPALTLPQTVLLLRAVLPKPHFDAQLALGIVLYRQRPPA